MDWEKDAKETFEKIINTLPQFHRSIAKVLVKESSEDIATKKGKKEVEISDLIEAFFKEVPPAFKEMMKKLFSKLNIDYTQYVNEGEDNTNNTYPSSP
jgi:UDP-N-acetyl-D-mannosaminuronate dehydrogenase